MRKPTWLAVIAWSEIIGGFAGLILLPLTYVQGSRAGLPQDLRPGALWYISGATVFLLTVAAGNLLRRGTALGRKASAVIQAAQIVRFSTSVLVYQFVTGFEFVVLVSATEGKLSPGIRAGFTAMPPIVPEPWSIGVNLFSVFLVVVLLRSLRQAQPTSDINFRSSPPAV